MCAMFRITNANFKKVCCIRCTFFMTTLFTKKKESKFWISLSQLPFQTEQKGLHLSTNKEQKEQHNPDFLNLSQASYVSFIPFLVNFGDEATEILKYYVIFVYILQGKMCKMEKIEKIMQKKVTKIPKTKTRKFRMNETFRFSILLVNLLNFTKILMIFVGNQKN